MISQVFNLNILLSFSLSCPKSPSPSLPTTQLAGLLSPGEGASKALCQSNVDLWHSSTPGTLSFGSENTNQCVHHELLLFQDHLLVNKLQVSAQEKQALILLPALWVPGQEEV